jgi:GNAT superfamily N-acetyltransferase
MVVGVDGRWQSASDLMMEVAMSDLGPIELRNLAPGDAGWIIERHAVLYAKDEGFDATFESLVAEILAAFLRAHDPSRERGWIAARGENRLGSIFCVGEDTTLPHVAKLRLFLVEPAARGTGLAQLMLDQCLKFARKAGYTEIRLWTHESHRAAGRLYARNGFALTSSEPTRSFGQDLVTQIWERSL